MTFAKSAIAGLMLLAPVAAHADVIDGSFETKGAALPVTSYCYDQIPVGNGLCASSPWTGSSGVIRSGEGAWGGTTTPFGSYYAFVQGLGVLTQEVSLDAGSYTLSWADAGRTNLGGPQSYSVGFLPPSARGPAFATLGTLGTFSTNGGGFTDQSVRFTVDTAGVYSLAFSGLIAEDRTSFIDNVSISAVPEPASWGLMILGFGAIGGALRTSRRRVGAALAA